MRKTRTGVPKPLKHRANCGHQPPFGNAGNRGSLNTGCQRDGPKFPGQGQRRCYRRATNPKIDPTLGRRTTSPDTTSARMCSPSARQDRNRRFSMSGLRRAPSRSSAIKYDLFTASQRLRPSGLFFSYLVSELPNERAAVATAVSQKPAIAAGGPCDRQGPEACHHASSVARR
jgi:hypothetical protein